MAANWEKIATDYMAGSMTYAQIARKHRVSMRQVEEHGRIGKWPEKRREYRGKVAERAQQKAMYKRSERAAENLARADEAAGLILEQLVEGLRSDPEQLRRHNTTKGEQVLRMLNGGNAAKLARTLESLAEVIRNVNDMPARREPEETEDKSVSIVIESPGGDVTV